MVADLFGRLAGESKTLTSKAAKATMDSRAVQTAVKLVLPVRAVRGGGTDWVDSV
jgi:hypothetical protein